MIEIFDERYYLGKYPDVSEAVKKGIIKNGYEHYILYGIKAGRYPNIKFEIECKIEPRKKIHIKDNDLDVDYYLSKYKIVQLFINKFSTVTPIDFFKIYGIRMGHCYSNNDTYGNKYKQVINENDTDSIFKKIISNFDVNFYVSEYPNIKYYPLSHYLMRGIKQGYNPNSWFDEKFYTSFYHDVDKLINEKKILCGFQHYLILGIKENRLCKHNLSKCLESVYNNITHPKRIHMVKLLEEKLISPKFRIINQDTQKKIWFMIPTLNPDIFFGGYTAYINFIDNTIKNGYNIGIYVNNYNNNMIKYFIYHYPNSYICKNLDKIAFYHNNNQEFVFNKNDIFVAYCCWDAILANHFTKSNSTPNKKFIFFIQEYEPAFYKNDSIKFISAQSYTYPHFPIFNSELLKNYFKQNQIGIFSNSYINKYSNPSYSVFEHVIMTFQNEKIQHSVDSRNVKKLIFYARPEEHTERNLFEIGILAIKNAISKGHFKGWIFEGFGSLSGPYVVDLGFGQSMKIYPKISSDKYENFISNADVGLSLMYCPHPGLVHFEMLNAGLVVVLNTYENRTQEYFKNVPRLIPVDLTIDEIVTGLIKAENLSINKEIRSLPSPYNSPRKWDQIFNNNYLQNIFNSV